MKRPAEIAHGPMFIGFVFNVLLYGIMVTQVYLYFTTFKKDKKWMKLFVLTLFIADSVNTTFDFVYIYNSLIIHFDDIPSLAKANWVFATDPAMTGIIAGLVQLFFAWRVKVLTSNLWLVAIVVACALSGGIAAVITAIEVGITPYFVDFRSFKVVVIIWLAAECLADILITSILVWYLSHKTGFQASDELVDRIIRMTVQTGLITALCAIVDLILYLVYPSGLHLIFNFPLSKLYTNSLMSSLNSRGGWSYGGTSQRSQNRAAVRSIIPTSEAPKSAGAVQIGIPPGPEVFVQVESQEMCDARSSENFMSESTSDPQTYHDDADSSVRGRWEDREEPVDERKSKDGDYNV